MLTSRGSPSLPTFLSAPLTLKIQPRLHDQGLILCLWIHQALLVLFLCYACFFFNFYFPSRSHLPQEMALGQ